MSFDSRIHVHQFRRTQRVRRIDTVVWIEHLRRPALENMRSHSIWLFIKIFSTFFINHFAIHTRSHLWSVVLWRIRKHAQTLTYPLLSHSIRVNVYADVEQSEGAGGWQKKPRWKKREFGWGVCMAASIYSVYWIYLFARTVFFLCKLNRVDNVIWWVMRTVCVYHASYMKYERQKKERRTQTPQIVRGSTNRRSTLGIFLTVAGSPFYLHEFQSNAKAQIPHKYLRFLFIN